MDYIDESEVLTMADEDNHINKRKFQVPFVCGCRNLGEALVSLFSFWFFVSRPGVCCCRSLLLLLLLPMLTPLLPCARRPLSRRSTVITSVKPREDRWRLAFPSNGFGTALWRVSRRIQPLEGRKEGVRPTKFVSLLHHRRVVASPACCRSTSWR